MATLLSVNFTDIQNLSSIHLIIHSIMPDFHKLRFGHTRQASNLSEVYYKKCHIVIFI